MTNEFDLKKLKQILDDPILRKRFAYEDPLWFCIIYLRHWLSSSLAPFHREMGHILKDPSYQFIAVMAFRGSGKSVIMNTANILWSILGKPQKKFTVIVSQTQEQARNHFNNIKDELKCNDLLRADFGPFTEDEKSWQKTSLELDYHGSKVMSISQEQSFRGLKYGTIRPDLIVCDDLEDIAAAQSKILRDDLWQRFASEIKPLGDDKTRIVVLGNLVCPDSFMMKVKREIERDEARSIFRAYPILDDNGLCLWPEKLPDPTSIEKMRGQFTQGVWNREFLLKILGWADGQDVAESAEVHNDPLFKSKHDPSMISYQSTLVRKMEPFKISVPIDTPPGIFSINDEEAYRRYYGNTGTPDQFMTLKERDYVIEFLGGWLSMRFKRYEHQRYVDNTNKELNEAYAKARHWYKDGVPKEEIREKLQKQS
jgi:hypothetical protein